MGMTIDEAIKHYEDMKKGLYLVYPEELYDFTIATMCNYQKIEQIVERFQKDDGYYFPMAWLDVVGVIEDGNDTTNTGNN